MMAGALAGDVLINATVGVSHRAHQRARSVKGVHAKREDRSRTDAQLLASIRAVRAKDPETSVRTIATRVLYRGVENLDVERKKDATRHE